MRTENGSEGVEPERINTENGPQKLSRNVKNSHLRSEFLHVLRMPDSLRHISWLHRCRSTDVTALLLANPAKFVVLFFIIRSDYIWILEYFREDVTSDIPARQAEKAQLERSPVAPFKQAFAVFF